MQYTPCAPDSASGAFTAAFAAIPDPRRARGRRFTLAAMLNLVLAAILANHLSPLAIAEWGSDQTPATLRALGFPTGTTPHQTTIHRLLRALDPARLAHALSRCLATPAVPAARGGTGVAVDGKSQRGRLPFAAPGAAPVHLLTAFCHDHGIALAQQEVAVRGEKAEAELTVAPALIAQVEWRGRVLTGDALYCQRDLCQQVVDAGGDYLVMVKENQPALKRDIATLFASRADTALAAASLPPWDMRAAETVERGHGRSEHRRLIASTALNDYLDWPALGQVVTVEREWREGGVTKRAVRYGITSLPPQVADAARLLALVRGHWQIENGLHYIKDVTLGEDRSTVRVGGGPTVLAMLRTAAVSVVRRAGWRTIAARLRHNGRHPNAALALLGITLTENA